MSNSNVLVFKKLNFQELWQFLVAIRNYEFLAVEFYQDSLNRQFRAIFKLANC